MDFSGLNMERVGIDKASANTSEKREDWSKMDDEN